jgi:exosome complex component MTR3
MDKKRISGPEQSVRPFVNAPVVPAIDAETGERKDGRGSEEFRPLFFKVGVIENATGSAYAESGQLKVICAV